MRVEKGRFRISPRSHQCTAEAIVLLKNETHFGRTNLIAIKKSTTEAAADGNGELIVRYTIGFFDQHLLGKDR